MAATIKAGIIGTGFIGPAHVEAARRLGNIEFVAIAEANEQLARQKAEALSIPPPAATTTRCWRFPKSRLSTTARPITCTSR